MKEEDRQRYNKMFETLSTEGWNLIRERLVEMYEQQNNIMSIADEKGFWQQRGALGVLNLIIELEAVFEAEVEQAEAAENVE
jgi:hypothetical protein|tara:strand:- start:2513 stop:2758 length:246 start_codon:yes stop_codon:yes gene_type:complete